MPANIAAANVTVTLDPRSVDFFSMAYKVSFPQISFGDGVNFLYPANGVPLPDISAFGMKKAVERIFIQPPPGDGFIYKYDSTHNTIRIYELGGTMQTGATGANTAGTPTGNLAAANVAVDALSGNLSSNALGGNTANGTGYVNATGMTTDTVAGTANKARVASKALSMEALANHTHTLSGTLTLGGLAELGNSAIAATVIDLMVIGS